MRALFFVFLLITTSAFAGLDRLLVQNLNANYTRPFGRGDVEKINIGFSTKMQGPYPVEIERTDKEFLVKSPFLDIAWNEPWPMFHNVENFFVSKANVSFGRKDHFATIDRAGFKPEGQGPFALGNMALKCNGSSTERKVENRILQDCHESLELKIETLDVPIDFFMSEIVASLPSQEPMEMDERPADNLVLTIEKGNLNMVVYTRVVFYAGIRAWGAVSYEDNFKVVVIRLDKVKFGYIPITNLVLKELKKRLKHPNVTINGNLIKILLQPHES